MSGVQIKPASDSVGTLGRRLSRLRQQPLIIGTLLLLLLILVTFILYPIYQIMVESFRFEGRLSLGNYQRFFTSRYFLHTLYNTLTISFLATLGAVVLGFIFAFGVTRTTMPGKKFFMLVSILPLITPPFFAAFAFILLLGRQGIFNQVLFSLFGIRWIIYGSHGVILAQVITLFPIAFLNLTAALSSIDPRLEEAAEDLGGSFWYVMRRVTLPLLTPAFFSSSLLILMFNLSAFGIPAILAGNNLFWRDASMLAPEAFFQILGFFNWGMGATLAVILLVPSLLLFIFQGWYIPRRSYITVSGIPTAFASRPSPVSVKRVIFAICTITALLVLSLYVVIFAGAVTQTWGVNYALTDRHINLMFRVGSTSIRNSLLLSIGGGLIAASLGALIAFVLMRWRFPGSQGFSFVAMLPYALPGTAIGLGFAAGFNAAPLLLTGTWMIILVDYAIRRMPFGIESSKSALSQIDISLEEAAADMGANWPVIFRRITMPLLRPTFVAAFVFCFIKSMTDITSVIFLVSPRWKVMSVDIYNYISAGRMGAAASMSALMVLLIIVLLAVVWKVSGLGYKIFKL